MAGDEYDHNEYDHKDKFNKVLMKIKAFGDFL